MVIISSCNWRATKSQFISKTINFSTKVNDIIWNQLYILHLIESFRKDWSKFSKIFLENFQSPLEFFFLQKSKFKHTNRFKIEWRFQITSFTLVKNMTVSEINLIKFWKSNFHKTAYIMWCTMVKKPKCQKMVTLT